MPYEAKQTFTHYLERFKNHKKKKELMFALIVCVVCIVPTVLA